MKTRRGTVVMIVLGVVVCVVIVGAGAAAWFFFSAFESTASDDTAAARRFDDVRSRFAGHTPLLEIRGEEVVRTRTAPAAGPRDLQRLNILTWNPDDERLAHIRLPWWLLRLKEGPIDVTSDAASGVTRTHLSITVEELGRYGPALLLDHAESDGSKVIVWTE